MEISQKTELRKLLVPQLTQSLNILALPYIEIKSLVEKELETNPLLEEIVPTTLSLKNKREKSDLDFRLTQIAQKLTLQDVLLRQLGMFTNSDEEFRIGQEIIGNIDENGYLKVHPQEIAIVLNLGVDKVENVLRIIQDFEPFGVGARTVSECLLIQLRQINEKDSLLIKLIEFHLDDIAKKNYNHIAKTLNEPLDKICILIKKISKLDPKPGRNYSLDEAQRIMPDVIIDDKGDELEIIISDEDIPIININKDYRRMIKDDALDPQVKAFLTDKLRNALELLRAISKRKFTLRRVVEIITQIQDEAIKNDLSFLKPLTFKEVAERLGMHESTVCRAIMNKYVKLPYGIVALKDFFPSHILNLNGESISSNYVKMLIRELIKQEDKKSPLSDQNIAGILLKKYSLNVSRRTVTKYREEIRLLSSIFRKER